VRGHYAFTANDFAEIGTWDHVHTSINSDLDADLPRLRAAAKSLSYDFSEKWAASRFAHTTGLIDITFLSCPTLADDEAEALLRTCGAPIAVATRGAAGALAVQGSAVFRQPVVPTELRDTLGAGDGFIAGFLVALLDGAPLPTALQKGANFAAAVCTWQGAFGHASPFPPT
jgi:fructoselysine 6-kinase